MASRDYPLAETPEPEILGLGNPDRRKENKAARQANRDARQYRREERREERQTKRNVCRKGKCGGRAKGFSGFN